MNNSSNNVSYYNAEWWLYGINPTPATVTTLQRRVPSCSMISYIEAAFRRRWEAQVMAFHSGQISEQKSDLRGYADPHPDETEEDENVWRVTRFPDLHWEAWMYTCYQYASASSGGYAQFFEDRHGVIVKVRREDPLNPTRDWSSLSIYPQYVPCLGPYEIRVSTIDFPVVMIRCRRGTHASPIPRRHPAHMGRAATAAVWSNPWSSHQCRGVLRRRPHVERLWQHRLRLHC